MELQLQPTSKEIWESKYQLKDDSGTPVDKDIDDTHKRVARALAAVETNPDEWYPKFLKVLQNGAVPAGRILSNAGAEAFKPKVSLINCVVSEIVEDSMLGIMGSCTKSAISLAAGSGIGYEFSTLRPKGAYVSGAGAFTSGPLPFMSIFDTMCDTVSSAGGRRGAQMGTFAVWHPDVEDFITAKRKDGVLRKFNLSLLIDDEFMEAVKTDSDWKLVFPVMKKENREGIKTVWKELFWDQSYCEKQGYTLKDGKILCRVYKTVKAADLWDTIMQSTYNFAEPGFLLIDNINKYNNNYFCERIRSTNPCVSAETLILTDNGEVPIIETIGKPTNVWNGKEWSKVIPFSTGVNPLMRVLLSDGTHLDCTPHHNWVLEDDSRVETKDLKISQALNYYSSPEKFPDNVKNSFTRLTVIGVEDLQREEETYCFTEPKNNTGTFNGIVTGQCGEQPLGPNGSCLLGSINLTKFVVNPFTPEAYFDFDAFEETVRIFTRMLDNVVEINGLPLEEQRHELITKRRHGMGFTGLGSTLSMLGVKYGGDESIEFTDTVMKYMAVTGFKEGVNLSKEKGCAPILSSQENRQKWVDGEYMKRIWGVWPEGALETLEHGCRFTHHTSIAPTGTISLSLGNNCSNGIEPSFSHKYTRNVIKAGKKTKDAVDVYSYEMLLYKHLTGNDTVPETFSTADTVTTKEHVDIQAAAQYWCDSSISKTINVATDMPYEEFKNVYIYAYDKGLKGCTTFRFNPAAFQGVLVKDEDLKNTKYVFHLEDGTSVEASGDTTIEYDGESHKAANLYDAIKEGQYGRF